MRNAIWPKQRLALTLRFLATGESIRSLEYQFLIIRKAISYIIDEVCRAIEVLAGTYLKCPSCQEDWRNIEKMRNGGGGGLGVVEPPTKFSKRGA